MATTTYITDSERPSPIIATLHARYEATWAEFNELERQEFALFPVPQKAPISFIHATKANHAESDAVRLAILLAVPTSWTEALILASHIVCSHGLFDQPSELEKTAFATALESLFDFLACELPDDHEKIGPMFQTAANHAHTLRTYRTGRVDA